MVKKQTDREQATRKKQGKVKSWKFVEAFQSSDSFFTFFRFLPAEKIIDIYSKFENFLNVDEKKN